MAKTPKNHGKSWSNQDVSKLEKLVKGNTPTGLLAYELGRTQEAIRAKASELEIPLKPTNQSPYNRLKE